VESGGLLAFNKVTVHWTQTSTAYTVDVTARQNTTYCATVSNKKRTLKKNLGRKTARKSWAACKEKGNGEA
jgi:hypothetical protein